MTPISTSRAAHNTARTPAGFAERPDGVSCGLVDGGVGSSGVGKVDMPTALTIYRGVKQLVGADGIEPPTAGV